MSFTPWCHDPHGAVKLERTLSSGASGSFYALQLPAIPTFLPLLSVFKLPCSVVEECLTLPMKVDNAVVSLWGSGNSGNLGCRWFDSSDVAEELVANVTQMEHKYDDEHLEYDTQEGRTRQGILRVAHESSSGQSVKAI